MSDDEGPVVIIPISDNLAAKTGCTAKWLDGDRISVTAYNHLTTTSPDQPSKYVNTDPVNIHHLQPEFIFIDEILRSLLCEANSIFLSVQLAARDQKSADYLKLSRTYRSIIRACLEKLQNGIDETSDRSNYHNYITIFYSIECVWHLCEILLIDPAPSNVVVPHLLEWVRFHFPAAERRAADLLFNQTGSDGFDEFRTDDDWMDVVRGLILQGQIEVAATVLKLRSDGDIAFDMTEEILRSMPIYNVYGGLSIEKFRSQWLYWMVNTKSKLNTGCLASSPDLEEIVKLITGDPEAWNEQARQSKCWYEYLPGYLYYTEPGCKYYELGPFADEWIRLWSLAHGHQRETSQLKHLERVIFELMQNDMKQVLHDIQKIGDNQWFVTHLTDLLYHCGQLTVMKSTENNSTIRNSLLFNFGTQLMSRESLWMFGIDYLEHSSGEGLGAIELLLPRVPVKTEWQAMKLIHIARQKGFVDVEQELCRIQAIRSLKMERYGNALEWSIRTQDSQFVTNVADMFLNHYATTGIMLSPDTLANVGSKMFISPRLVFLIKYFDFHQYYQEKEFLKAAEILINLLNSKITPGYLWPSLLADSIPLLESKDLKLSTKDTYTILHYLESKLVPLIEEEQSMVKMGYRPNGSKLLKDYRMENLEEMIQLLRKACVRNLSRAIIVENTAF